MNALAAFSPEELTAIGLSLRVAFWAMLCSLPVGRALGEFGATITFVSNIPGETQTLPTAIYMLIQVPGGDLAALRLTIVSIVISLAALFVSEVLIERATRRALGL